MARRPGSPPTRSQVEIELRDKISTGLKEIAQNLKALKQEAATTEVGSGQSFDRIGGETSTFQKRIVEATDYVETMGGKVSGLAKSILGISGAAGAIVLLAKSLTDFATNRVRLQAFARDTGLATTQIERMEQAMERMGYSSGEARGHVNNLMGQLRQFYAMPDVGATPLSQALTAMGGHGDKVLHDLYGLMDQGKWNEAVHLLASFYRRQSAEAQTYLSNALGGIPPSLLNSLEEYETYVKYLFDGDEKRTQDFLNNVVDFKGKIQGEWYHIAEHVIGQANRMFEAYDKAGDTHAFSEWVISEFDAIVKTVEETKKEIEGLINLLTGKTPFDTPKINFAGPAFTATPGGIPTEQALPFQQPPPEALRQYAAGSNFVQQTGLAVVHEGEQIIPARDAIQAAPTDAQMFAALGGLKGLANLMAGPWVGGGQYPNHPGLRQYFPQRQQWAPGSTPTPWSQSWGNELVDWLGIPHDYGGGQSPLESQDTQRLKDSKESSKRTLDEVRTILLDMEEKGKTLPSYQFGTSEVQETGYANLHAGERVWPSGFKVRETGPAMVFKGDQVVPAGIVRSYEQAAQPTFVPLDQAVGADARSLMDRNLPSGRSPAIDFKVRANAVPAGVKVNSQVDGPLFEGGTFSQEHSKHLAI